MHAKPGTRTGHALRLVARFVLLVLAAAAILIGAHLIGTSGG
jgi:hypothetical protein